MNKIKKKFLADLARDYVQFRSIGAYYIFQRADLEEKYRKLGFKTMDDVRSRFGDLKKKEEILLKPYAAVAFDKIPDKPKQDLKIIRDERLKLEADIDKYESFGQNIEKNLEQQGETLFHYRAIKNHGDEFIKKITNF